ncbi:hypothetical protein Ddc_18290 [Ditylenchus destructor]|nr:hypothetical protein Ddc_18290 [Ditylenchus destructor]
MIKNHSNKQLSHRREQSHPELIHGSVACHDQTDVCTAFAISHQNLHTIDSGELLEAIDSGKMVLVLFWTNAQSVSSHAFELWARVAKAWKRKNEGKDDPELILGSVACHDQTDVCTAFAISHQNQHTIYAYNAGKLIASQVYMREESFYLQWLDIIVSTKPLKGLENAEELAKAKAGTVPDMPGIRLAVTIGTFSSEESEELRRFKKIAQMLNGRYHLVYFINPKHFRALFRHSLHPLVGYASKEATNEVGFVREVRPAELENLHPLVGYASKEATNEVGFVRKVRPAELEKCAEENVKEMRERSKFSPPTIFINSPYELGHLNQRFGASPARLSKTYKFNT